MDIMQREPDKRFPLLTTDQGRASKHVTAMTDIITDYDLQALVDGHLSAAERARLHAYLARNPDARERIEELVEQKTLLRRWWNTYKKPDA